MNLVGGQWGKSPRVEMVEGRRLSVLENVPRYFLFLATSIAQPLVKILADCE